MSLCQERLREWRRLRPSCAVVDPRKAYLQIRIHPSLWRYQVIRLRGETYALARLGFVLNIAPKLMTKIVEKVLQEDDSVKSVTSNYIDDIGMNQWA